MAATSPLPCSRRPDLQVDGRVIEQIQMKYKSTTRRPKCHTWQVRMAGAGPDARRGAMGRRRGTPIG